MRFTLAVLLSAVAFAAAAQSTARPRPAGTMPLDEVPAPPPITADVPDLDEPATARRGDDGQVTQEYRARGRMYAQRVTPRHGRSYVLFDPKTDGSLTKQDNSIDGHLAVPQWVLMEF